MALNENMFEYAYVPTETERRLLMQALDESACDPGSLPSWSEVRDGFGRGRKTSAQQDFLDRE